MDIEKSDYFLEDKSIYRGAVSMVDVFAQQILGNFFSIVQIKYTYTTTYSMSQRTSQHFKIYSSVFTEYHWAMIAEIKQ